MADHLSETDVIPVHLQLAAGQLDDLAKTLEKDVIGAFGRAMHPFTESTAGNHPDRPASSGVRSGADDTWTNPLGTSDGAETYFQVLDNCRDSANKDAAALLAELRTMADLLRTVRSTYLTNEAQVTKQFVDTHFTQLTNQPPASTS
jgi:hypothetical protein